MNLNGADVGSLVKAEERVEGEKRRRARQGSPCERCFFDRRDRMCGERCVTVSVSEARREIGLYQKHRACRNVIDRFIQRQTIITA